MVERSVRFEALSSLARLAGMGWWMVTFDLAQGYHHLLMAPSAQKLLGFQFQGKWFRYRVLPFGLCWSPWIFTKVIRAMITYWRRQGIFCMAYIDDFVVLAPTWEELLQIRDQIIGPTLSRLGWVREPSKGQWEPVQRAEVLGLDVDLEAGRFVISQQKIAAIQAQIRDILQGVHTKRQIA